MPSSPENSPEPQGVSWAPGHEAAPVAGNRPWLLDEPAVLWGVAYGAVDVFAVRLDADGAPGARHFVTRVGADALLCGAPAGPPGDGAERVALLAVPAGTAGMVRVARADLWRELAGPADRMLLVLAAAEWAEKLSTVLPEALRPAATMPADPGSGQELPAGVALVPRGGDRCVRVTQGAADLVSDAALTVTASDGWLPLTGASWLEAREPATIDVVHLAQALGAEPALAPLDTLVGLVLRRLAARVRREDELEVERLLSRERALAKAFHATITRQAAVLDSGSAGVTEGGEDDLLAACRAVGGRLGIHFVSPPEAWGGRAYTPVSAIARASHVRYREVTLEGEWWRHDNGPLLGFLADGAPVALLPRTSSSYRVAPQDGRAPFRVGAAEAAGLQPRACMFYRPLPARSLRGRDLVAFVLRGTSGELVALAVFSLLAALIGLAVPIFTGVVFDNIIPSGSGVGLSQMAAVLLVIAVVLGALSFARGVATVRLQGRIDNSLQAALWDRLLTLPAGFFRRFTAGDLAMRVMSVNQMSTIIFNTVVLSVFGAVFSLVNLALIFFMSPELATLALVLVVVAVVVSLVVALAQLRERRAVFALQGKLSGDVLQLVSAIAKLRDTGAEERAFARWSDGFVAMSRHTVKADRIAIVGTVFDSAYPLLCSVGAFAIYFLFLSSAYQTGQFMAYTTAFAQLLAGLLALAMALTQLTNVAPLYGRAKPLLEAEPEVTETKADPGRLRGHIEMTKVTFGYEDAAVPTLREVSLEVRPGEFVAIVGPSGAGKSTIFRLLLGFEQPLAGEIHYDGQDLRTLDLAALRRQISTVLQNGRVFSGAVYLNIAGAAQLTQDEAWEAARAAGLAADIEAMPMGMFTFVAEGGVTLSGGQRQRLLIARALATQPTVLLFDEATSALDNRTQAVVMDGLKEMNASRLVIAQRLSTVKAADRIYVLEDGAVAQCGTFEELIAKPGLFRRLAERQLV